MAIAGSNDAVLAFKKESAWGETPVGTGSWSQVPYTGEDIKGAKQTVASENIRADRARSGHAELAFNAGGPLNVEMTQGAFDDIYEGLMSNTFGTTTDLSSVAANATGNKFEEVTIDDNIVVGQWILAEGFTNAANNGLHLVTATAVGEVSVASTLVTEGATAAKKVSARMIRNTASPTDVSLLLEKDFTDISENHYINGLRVGGLGLTINAGEVVNGVWTFQGKEEVNNLGDLGASPAAAPLRDPMTASANVATIYYDDAALTTAVRAVSIDVTTSLREQIQVGSSAPAGIGYGFFDVTGTLEAYFEDSTLYDAMKAHTYHSLAIPMTDPAGNGLVYTVSDLVFTDGSPVVPGGNQDLTVPLTFAGRIDATYSTTIQIDEIPKPT